MFTYFMKKLLLGLALTIATFTVQASHLLGGMVGVAQTSFDSTSVGVWLISDNTGIPMPNTIYVERWEWSGGVYTQSGSIALDKITTSTHQGTSLTNYVSDYMDLDSGQYRFIYKNCCWGYVLNSTSSMNSEFVISADYSHIPNNSTPYAVYPLWVNMQHYKLNTMTAIWGNIHCFFKNPDTDSVVIMQDSLWSGYSSGVFSIQNHQPLNMHVSNDSISWEPHSVGPHATGFRIEDWRNGQLIGVQRIQWTFRVVTSTVGIRELQSQDKTPVGVWNISGQYIQEDTKDLPAGQLYLVRYSDGSFQKLWIVD